MLSFKSLTLGFSVTVYLFHLYLDTRQLKALHIPHSPPAMTKHRPDDPTEFRKTQAYNLDKWWFSCVHGIWNIAFDLFFLTSDLLPRLWYVASQLVASHGFARATEIQTSVAFCLLFAAIPMMLDIPWSLYSTFVIEERHGFNKQTLRLFVTDLIKSVLLALVVGPPLIAAFTYLLLHSGPRLVAYVWLFMLGVQLIALTVYPTLIAPLWNKFTPLPDGALREGIEALASSLNFPLKKLFVVDGSTRSAHSNAYFFGLGKNKRIVLFDTLVEQCSTDQIVAVLAHELGHWSLGHIQKNLVLANVVLLCQFLLFDVVQHNDSVLADFGFVKQRPALARFILFTYLLAPLDEVLGFFSHVLSRRYEFQADAFAVDLGKADGLKGGLLSLESTNRSAPNVDPLYSAFHYSHPPIPERLQAIEDRMKKQK